MNKNIYQNNPNEWIVTNETGEIRIINTNDVSVEEIKNILLKEDELKTLIKEKNDLMKKIDKVNNAGIIAKRLNKSFLKFIIAIVVVFVSLLFIFGFNIGHMLITFVASIIIGLLCAAYKIDLLHNFGTKKIRAELINGYEKTLAKLKEREPKLIDEINMLKEKYHFIEESGELTSIPEVKEKLIESEKQNEYSLNKDDEFPKRIRRKNR